MMSAVCGTAHEMLEKQAVSPQRVRCTIYRMICVVDRVLDVSLCRGVRRGFDVDTMEIQTDQQHLNV